MNEQRFFAEREGDWKALMRLTDRADASVSQLDPEAMQEFLRLYKRVSRDLALVRTESGNRELAAFLNDLVARAYGVLYRPRHRSIFEGLAGWIALAPRTVRKHAGAFFASLGLSVAAAVIAFLCLTHIPDTRDYFIPPELEANFESWKSGQMEDRTLDEAVAMTGMYASNNPRVAIITAASAASTFGLFSAQILFQNGAILGALTYEVNQTNRVGYLYVRIMPHGVTELTGVLVAGQSGFVMGWAMLRPGRRTRWQALKETAPDALVLMLTGVTLMFLAAPIEGFISFNPRIPDIYKILFSVFTFVMWFFFWTGYGQTEPRVKKRRIRRLRPATRTP